MSFRSNTAGILERKIWFYNNRIAKLEVDPETYTVKVDGEEITCEPAGELALAQRYFLF